MPNAVPTHRPARPPIKRDHSAYDRSRRDREAKAFYHTRAWLKLRLLKLAETPYCERCYREDRLVRASHVHHKVEVKDDPDLRLDPDNLESLCHPCHSRHHRHIDGIHDDE